MLETCASVQEAIAFYQQNSEPSFSRARILIADKTGASVIVGAKDGYVGRDGRLPEGETNRFGDAAPPGA